ncbi:MAG: hypothetical protein N2441_10635, partial [Rhodocyclaceae bacterium]|nr:hypothetical protein [Rhodocyclaceae bacterium]
MPIVGLDRRFALGALRACAGLLVALAWLAWAWAEPLIAAVADFETILATKSERLWIHRYAGRQPIFIFDFPTLGQQGRMFNRVGALTERLWQGHARVLDDQELAAFIRSLGKTEYTFAYGNDFLVSELVVFFNLAEQRGVPLNEEERSLKAFLLEQGLMRERYGFLQAIYPNAVILSIPQEKPAGEEPSVNALARRTILMHELAHAEYYTNPDYRAWCRKFWFETLTEAQREKFRAFLAGAGYDRSNEDLMINEAQAYLSFTPDARAFSARSLGVTEYELMRLREAFRAGAPAWPL